MTTSNELLRTAQEKLYTAVLSDTLDSLGYRNQVMHQDIRPLDDDLVLFGRARTGLFHDIYHVKAGENPYALEIALIDDLKPGEVPVMACGASGRIAL